AIDPPVFAAVGERGAPLDEGGAGTLRALREVLEVAGVADVLRVYAETQVVRQFGEIGEPHAAAGAAEDVVVGQIAPVELAVLALRQKAQIAPQAGTALAVLDGLEGKV